MKAKNLELRGHLWQIFALALMLGAAYFINDLVTGGRGDKSVSWLACACRPSPET